MKNNIKKEQLNLKQHLMSKKINFCNVLHTKRQNIANKMAHIIVNSGGFDINGQLKNGSNNELLNEYTNIFILIGEIEEQLENSLSL